MPSDILKEIAGDFKKVEPQIAEAEELIAALKEAGEDTAAMSQELRTLKRRKTQWERMLRNRSLL